ncbi:acyl-CoA dehydrogenase family protein [Hydrogenophaga sp. BPS33]|uniref:acyl-CoA dehydrogenase family protein n=1 Tax=Hydrogenophaga sp. BPS33 TaxID=2651974 RepID=UPI00131FF2BD|nr:acyl-CoA dehydrogenase family protein [Hydrogenophaga sp. BPS33]QHE83916.1 acyl-CoA dehydrogenase [Hydrogenophaga sp. BPS33]
MNELCEELGKSLARLSEETCTSDVLEAAEQGVWPAAVWRGLEEIGLVLAALPEDAGGVGLDLSDLMYIVDRSAYHTLPVPLVETYLAGRLLVSAGIDVPEGALTVAPVRGERFAIAGGEGAWSIEGTAHRVPWGNVCGHAVVVAEQAGEDVVALVRLAPEMVGEQTRNLSGEPRVDLSFNGASVVAARAVPGARQQLEFDGALMRAVQMTGAMERALELSLLYANERVQFGRPIGKFQAVQQMLAVMAGHVAASKAAVDFAVHGCANGLSLFPVAIAKARAGEAAGLSAEIAHQVHGAMGITREHRLHFSTRRLWAWRDEFGAEVLWQRRLGELVAQQGPDALWPTLTAFSE